MVVNLTFLIDMFHFEQRKVNIARIYKETTEKLSKTIVQFLYKCRGKVFEIITFKKIFVFFC